MSLLFAATYPERTTALITFGSFAKLVPTLHYLWELHGVFEERRRLFTDAIENWGEGKVLARCICRASLAMRMHRGCSARSSAQRQAQRWLAR